jgi:hypothetical protein
MTVSNRWSTRRATWPIYSANVSAARLAVSRVHRPLRPVRPTSIRFRAIRAAA